MGWGNVTTHGSSWAAGAWDWRGLTRCAEKMGIIEATFYVWKKKYSGIGPSELRRPS